MDNHHVRIYPSQISCGILELSSIAAEHDKVLYAIANYLYHPSRRNDPACLIIWSDLPGSNGALLANHIKS